MKKIIDSLNIENLSIHHEEKQSYTTIDPLAVKLVEYVFAKFYILCRGSDVIFADSMRLKAEKTQWQVTFTRENLTKPQDIQKALLKLEKHKYPNPPQLGEFLSWNESSAKDLGLLTKEEAFNRSAEYLREGHLHGLSDIQNQLIALAVKESDRFFLRNNSISKTQPVFQRNYEIIVRNFLDGKIESIPKGIVDQQKETEELKKQEEVAKGFDHLRGYEECMPVIRKILGMNPDGTTKSDNKR